MGITRGSTLAWAAVGAAVSWVRRADETRMACTWAWASASARALARARPASVRPGSSPESFSA